MKIFLSHSSKQKLLVREVKSRLPDFIEIWIDEKDINAGDNLEEKIREGIINDCDYVLLFLDEHAANSSWVKTEIEYSLELESRKNRPVLIPFLIDEKAIETISQYKLGERKYIGCFDFSEEHISAACSQLVTQLFSIVINRNDTMTSAQLSKSNEFEDAERTIAKYGKIFREAIFAYRRQNPITIPELRGTVNRDTFCNFQSDDEMLSVLTKLRQSAILQGIFFDNEIAFLASERVNQKCDLNRVAKQSIARQSSLLISDDMVIGIDGGSTTQELVNEMCRKISGRLVFGLSIITNSIPAASRIADCLNDLETSDRDAACRVYLLGGECRPISMSTLQHDAEIEIDRFLRIVGKGEMDLSFVGANGVNGTLGIANNKQALIDTKRQLFEKSKHCCALMESRKLGIQQNITFAEFCDKLSIYTNHREEHSSHYEVISSHGSKIVFC